MEKEKIGCSCVLKPYVSEAFGYKDGIVFKVKDVLEGNLPYPIVLVNEDFGTGWREFFSEEEIELF